MTSRRLALTAAGIGLVALSGIWLWGVLTFSQRQCDGESPETMVGFVLPVSAQDLEFECYGSNAYRAEVVFNMLPEDVDPLVNSTSIALPLREGSGGLDPKTFPIAPDEGITSFLYGGYETDGYDQYLLIDTTDPDVFTVYLLVLSSG